MNKKAFIEKWATTLFKKAGITEGLAQQLVAEFKRDLDTVITSENNKLWQEVAKTLEATSLHK